ncbi:MAG: GNAT family N-acetyltransferase [Bryobacteraceae bacterium]
MRGHRLEDLDSSAALWNDPRVTRYIGGVPLSREESWSRLLRYAGHWALLGFGYWVAEERSTGTFVGELGFADYKRDLQPPFPEMPEAGWVLAPTAQGKGFATEAVRAINQWGDIHFAGKPTACLIHPENAASIRVAKKCGYEELRRATYKNRQSIVFVRNAPR